MCHLDPSPDEPPSEGDRVSQIVGMWNNLRTGGDAGATTWEVLDALEQEVTGELAKSPPDLANAWSKTVKAWLLMTDCLDA